MSLGGLRAEKVSELTFTEVSVLGMNALPHSPI